MDSYFSLSLSLSLSPSPSLSLSLSFSSSLFLPLPLSSFSPHYATNSLPAARLWSQWPKAWSHMPHLLTVEIFSIHAYFIMLLCNCLHASVTTDLHHNLSWLCTYLALICTIIITIYLCTNKLDIITVTCNVMS